jgi:feruloyl esterase
VTSPGISAENGVNYYSSVLTRMGSKEDDWYRLFIVSGMMHCRQGPGTNQFNANAMGALESNS